MTARKFLEFVFDLPFSINTGRRRGDGNDDNSWETLLDDGFKMMMLILIRTHDT